MSVRLAPELFVIRAISPEPQRPENENYMARIKLNNGDWVPEERAMKGTHEERIVLTECGVNPASIDAAIEELSRSRTTTVSR